MGTALGKRYQMGTALRALCRWCFATLGQSSGFQAQVKRVSLDCAFIHFMSHRAALASNILSTELMKVLHQVTQENPAHSAHTYSDALVK